MNTGFIILNSIKKNILQLLYVDNTNFGKKKKKERKHNDGNKRV